MKSKFLHQFSWLLLGRVIAAFLQALIIILLARAVAPSEFGLLMSVVGISIVLQAVADLGISKLVVRERSRDKDSRYIAAGLRLNTQSALLLWFIGSVLLILFGVFVDPFFIYLVPLAISTANEKVADTWLGIAIADGDVWLNSLNLVGRRTIAILLFVLLNLSIIPSALAYTSSLAAASLVSMLFAFRHIRNRFGRDRKSLSELIKAAFPFWTNTLASQLRNLDTALVSAIAGPLESGFYATAARSTSPLKMLPDSIATILLPLATRQRHRSLLPMILGIILITVVLALFYVGLAILMPRVVPAVLGTAYFSAVQPMQIVLVGLIFSGLSSLVSALMQGRDMQNQVAWVSIATTGVILLSIVVLTFTSGAIGAAIGLTIGLVIQSFSLVTILCVMEVKRGKPSR